MKSKRISRRRFILAGLLLAPVALFADAKWIEPDWIRIRRMRLTNGPPVCRFVHFTDLHHKGDRAHTQSVIDMINGLKPDFTCFTGDLIEQEDYLPEALELLSGIQSPVYGVPGNHDYGSGAPFAKYARCFSATGGAWLLNQHVSVADGKVNIMGIARLGGSHPPPPAQPGAKNILLMHFPAWAKRLGNEKYDLILAGHSHGCQVRIPFYGPVITPYNVDEYDLGLFQTAAGPLYVNPGIGWFPLPVRFNCRPEITVFEV